MGLTICGCGCHRAIRTLLYSMDPFMSEFHSVAFKIFEFCRFWRPRWPEPTVLAGMGARTVGSGARPGQNQWFCRGQAPEPSVLAVLVLAPWPEPTVLAGAGANPSTSTESQTHNIDRISKRVQNVKKEAPRFPNGSKMASRIRSRRRSGLG